MDSRLQWILAQFTRRLWFRAALFGIAAVATALVAAVASPFFPDDMSNVLGAEAVEDILRIMASSMLAVATFSLGTMVAAYAAAASTATPRATTLLIEDPTSQNAISTFIGTFIFSLVGIVALSTNYYGPGGRIVLFLVTIVIITLVVVTFFRWIDYLSNLNRLSAVVDKVEAATTRALRSRCQSPFFGGRPLRAVPSDAVPLYSAEIGYVQHFDIDRLSRIAEKARHDLRDAPARRAYRHLRGFGVDVLATRCGDAACAMRSLPRWGVAVLRARPSVRAHRAVGDRVPRSIARRQ